MQPLVEIVIVNYNGYEDTIECLRSLNKITYENYQTVVVDNGSTKQPTEEQIRFIKEHAIYLKSEENRGFAGGNNYGVACTRELKPDYLLLLNNDTEVCEGFLEKLVETAQAKPDAGIVCGKINWYDEKDQVWFGGGVFDPKTCYVSHTNCGKDLDNSNYVMPIEFSTGCMQLIPLHVWQQVGPMDERFFLYAEDLDFCRLVRNAGYQIYYRNDAKIFHKVSRSTGRDSDYTQYYYVRNELYIIQRYATNKPLAYGVKMARFAMDILKRRKRIIPVLAGILDFCKGIDGQRRSK